MRTRLLVLLFLCLTDAAWAAARVLTPAQATARRGQLVTIGGVLEGLGGHPDGLILRVGPSPAVPVFLPTTVRRQMRHDPTTLIGKSIEVTGFVSGPRSPLSLRVGHAGQLVVSSDQKNGAAVPQRLATLERAVERLAPRLVAEARTAVVISSTGPTRAPVIERAATQNTVLAYRGVPSRVEWSNQRRVLYYGREQYRFDAQGQLLDVQRN